jgi:hypothetical protein
VACFIHFLAWQLVFEVKAGSLDLFSVIWYVVIVVFVVIVVVVLLLGVALSKWKVKRKFTVAWICLV